MIYKRLERSSLPNEVVNQILQAIRDGTLKPGDRLPSETSLSKTLNVGRTTIREAMVILVTMGLVDRSRKGTFIRPDAAIHTSQTPVDAKKSTAHHVFEARRALESVLAFLAAQRATEDDLQRIQEAIDTVKSANGSDPTRLLHAEWTFHTRVAEAAKNPVLLQMFCQVRDLWHALHADIAEMPDATGSSLAHHQALLDAIASGDPARARYIVENSLAEVESSYLRFLSQELQGEPDT